MSRIPSRAFSSLGKSPVGALARSKCRQLDKTWKQASRAFRISSAQRTDGVYTALTEMRVRTPWIEAWRKSQGEEGQPSKPAAPPPAQDTSPKKMSDSYHSFILPLAQDPWLLDTYLNATGHIRLGSLLMDLDALSGIIAYKHTGESVTTVTAAVDRITIKNPRIKDICDLEMSGQVTFATGRSSMEISLQVAKAPEEGQKVKPEDVLMTCAFTMVSLDPTTKKPVNISPLKVENAEEKRIFKEGEDNYNAKKAMLKTALRKQTPNDEESDLIHAMWLKQLEYHDPNVSAKKPHNVLYMDSTKLHSAQIMQPQYRNRHNFMIFGGFLLKQTFELAFCCAASFSHTRPTFISLDPSTFDNPVPVGSVLYMTATVVYTDPPLVCSGNEAPNTTGQTRVQIRVDSKVRDVQHGETKPTGQFNYTFLIEKDLKIMPKTYSEFMMWVDARRRAMKVAAAAANASSSPGTVGSPAEDSNMERITE